MAFAVLFGTDTKKRNSTKIPTLSASVQCLLKAGTSAENPTFILQGVGNLSPFSWNVASCAAMGNRYYFIEDVRYFESTYEIICTCDYLATYRAEILASTQYVTRSASLWNADISDALFPTTAASTISKTLSGSFGFSNKGSIIVTTAGKSGNSFHALSPEQFSNLCNYLYSSTFLDALSDWTKVGEIVQKQLFRTNDYIISACWIPVAIGGGSDPIALGPVANCGSGTAISNGRIWGSVVSVTAPQHPQSEGYAYRNIEPFSRFTLTIPYIGTIPISGSFIKANRTISIGMGMDVNGNVDCTVFSPSGQYGTFFGSAGSNVGFSSRSSNGGGQIVRGAGELTTSVATGNFVMAAAGILNLAAGASGADIISSGSGGCVAQDDFCTLTATFRTQTTVDVTHFGRPLATPTQLSSLSGFCQCENASVPCSATESGKQTINNFLNGGFYIE